MSHIITAVLFAFACIGVIDKLFFKNKYGYGEQFDEGFHAMGPLSLSMLGVMCGAPVLGMLLTPVFTPLYQLIGSDSAMLAGSLLAVDMGGYPLACSMTDKYDIQVFSGIILATMMGSTISFSIPVALSIIDKEDEVPAAKGFLMGFVAVPFGVFAGAVLAGIGLKMIFINLLPIIVLSLLLALGLWKIPQKMLVGFRWFSKGIITVIHIFLLIAMLDTLFGITIFKEMAPLKDQAPVILYIAITLSGAYPMIHFITVILKKPLEKLSGMLHISVPAITGMLACLANNIPTFVMLKTIPGRDKTTVVAFSVCASFALGDYLGYIQAQLPELTAPMILGKLCGGIVAVVLCRLLYRQ